MSSKNSSGDQYLLKMANQIFGHPLVCGRHIGDPFQDSILDSLRTTDPKGHASLIHVVCSQTRGEIRMLLLFILFCILFYEETRVEPS